MNYTPSEITSLFVFNSNYGLVDEKEKILYYYPKEIPSTEKLNKVGLSEALINFARTFSPKKPCNSLHLKKERFVFYQPESEFWMVMVVRNPFVIKIQKNTREREYEYYSEELDDTILSNALQRLYYQFRLFNGTFQQIITNFSLRVLNAKIENILTQLIKELDFNQRRNSILLPTIVKGIEYIQLPRQIFLNVQYMFNIIKNRFDGIHKCAFWIKNKLVFSEISKDDTLSISYWMRNTFEKTFQSEIGSTILRVESARELFFGDKEKTGIKMNKNNNNNKNKNKNKDNRKNNKNNNNNNNNSSSSSNTINKNINNNHGNHNHNNNNNSHYEFVMNKEESKLLKELVIFDFISPKIQKKKTKKTKTTNSQIGFLTGPENLRNQNSPINAPLVLVGDDYKKRYLIIFRYKDFFFVMLICPSIRFNFSFYRELNTLLIQKLRSIEILIKEKDNRQQLQPFNNEKYLYYNFSNFGRKSSITQENHTVTKVLLSIFNTLKFDLEKPRYEIIVKTDQDTIVVGKKTHERILLLVFSQKNITFKIIDKKVKSIADSIFGSIII
ncbi:hypothetical protein M0813_23257 [Anaeramoeba flamelloides]|uniref:CCZ1/INTU/HSP4 first Longin domain-containing protein n=1 Tax=Anaeramoeba flamelloides TaxID=1746091 RepID=A0ABQ8YA19_9EUKA|nr:hypothetical protein M0813_23257 [Anaeramoeba flamelloides]